MLLAGAFAGLLTTFSALVEAVAPMPLPGTVAIVGDRAIRAAEVVMALDRLGLPDDAQSRARAADYLVDEELLVMRARELGLLRSDPAVRKTLASSMVDRVVAAPDRPPTPEQLRDWFGANRDRFVSPARLRVRRIRFSGARPDAQARAREAQRRLAAGESFERVASDLGADEIVAIPETLLPVQAAQRYLGPEAVAAVMELEVGEWTAPIAAGRSASIVQLLEHRERTEPEFEEVESAVVAQYRRERGERALREYLDRRRSEVPVVVAPLSAREQEDGERDER